MRRLAALALLVLAACGGSGGGNDPGPPGLDLGPPPSATVYVRAVPPGTWSDGRLAEYDQVGADGFVRIRSDIIGNTTLATRTLAHELGHALGFAHLTGSGCVMDDQAYQTPNVTLCPAEASAAASYAGPVLTVYVGLEPGLSARTADAAAAWNTAHGGTILAVQ